MKQGKSLKIPNPGPPPPKNTRPIADPHPPSPIGIAGMLCEKERHGTEKSGRPSSSSSLPPAKLAGETERQSATTSLVSFFCCPAHCDRSSSPPRKCNVHPPCLHTSDLGILAWIWDGCGLLNVRQYVARD